MFKFSEVKQEKMQSCLKQQFNILERRPIFSSGGSNLKSSLVAWHIAYLVFTVAGKHMFC